MSERLYRSRDDRMIAGVAGGLAERLDVDPALIRIVWAVLVIPTGFLALLVYVVAALVVPDEDDVIRLADGATRPTPAGAGWPADPAGPPAPWTASYPVAAPTSGPLAAPPPMGPPPQMGPPPMGPPPQISPPAVYRSRRARRRAERAARHQGHGRGATSVIVGGGLIVLGCWFLFREYFPDLDASRFWPIAVVGLGVLLVIVALSRRSDAPDGDH